MKKRTFKTLGVCVLAGMIMASTMAMGVSADEQTYKVTVNQAEEGITGTFNVYKVATVNKNGNAYDYEYTNGFTGEALESTVAGYSSNSKEAQEYALALAGQLNGKTAVASGAIGSSVDLDPGYYLVTISTNNTGMVAAPSLVLVTDSATSVQPKTSQLTFEKKIAEIDNGGSVSSSHDTGVGEIGATVTYNINTRLPKYAPSVTEVTDFVITDDPSDGIKYDINNDDMKVIVGGSTLKKGADYTVAGEGDGFKLTIKDTVVLENGGKDVVVSFDATIDTDAEIGSAGNPNDANLVYGNDYATGGGEGHFDDKVTVYTTQITINKTDDKGEPLPGAGFAIYRKGETTPIQTIDPREDDPSTDDIDESSTFVFKGLDEGTYVIKEVKMPNGYKQADDKEITITADKEDSNVELEFVGTFNGGKELIEETVINTPGKSLPGTGGIGTTIFTVTGASLVVAAGAMLTVYLKKRKAEEE